MILWAKLKSIARKQTVGANLRAAAIKYDGKAVADRTDEPFANDRVEDNLNVVGRLYYSASTTLCCAHSLSEDGAAALGNPASVSNKSIRKQKTPKPAEARSMAQHGRREIATTFTERAEARAGRAIPMHG